MQIQVTHARLDYDNLPASHVYSQVPADEITSCGAALEIMVACGGHGLSRQA